MKAKEIMIMGLRLMKMLTLLSPYIRHRIITEEEVMARAISKFPLPKIEKFIQEVFLENLLERLVRAEAKSLG